MHMYVFVLLYVVIVTLPVSYELLNLSP